MTPIAPRWPSVPWFGRERPLPPLPEERTLAPIAVMSFNRPAYLEPVLVSLLAQRQDVRRRRILFYQDGAVSPITGRRFAEDADIAACRELFRRMVPWGEERFADHNLGVAKNFRRAEAELFADPANAIVYFLEDDLVLHPHYLDLMDRLALKTDNFELPVSHFSAFGELTASPRQQFRRRYRLRKHKQNWAFGLRRAAWEASLPLLAEYYAFIEGCDYRDRDTPGIIGHYASRGMPTTVSSQDGVKLAIAQSLGFVAIGTTVAAGRYIGAVGEHMLQHMYDEAGFARTRWLDRVEYDWTVPGRAELEAMRRGVAM